MIKRYSIFHPIVLSFFSQSLYRDVATKWRGVGYLYLFMLLMICWIPTLIYYSQEFKVFANAHVLPIAKQLPDIQIKDGRASINKPSPYIINDNETNKPLIIFDTSGQYKTLENTSAVMLITDKSFFVQGKDKAREYEFDPAQTYSLTAAKAHQLLSIAINWLAVILYPVALFFSLIYRIIQTLLYAIVGLIIARSFDRNLDFISILRIVSIALSPAIILSTIFTVTNVSYPFMFLSYFAISIFYICFGVLANPRMVVIN